ncbi:protein GPR108 isoform X1 [Anabas testudineus]|uniref:protein GPR108 isoform X1 n=1 Tax=Anabas testudineus TaxID=64144 RepID=UPI000E45D439|nr:protein GPR108 isoform X1 [Anabas testudineus]
MAAAHRGCVVAGCVLLLLLVGCNARKHTLTLKNETRTAVDLNNFGFYANGTLDVNLLSLHLPDKSGDHSSPSVGFTLSRSRMNGVFPYTTEEAGTCPLSLKNSTNEEPLIVFVIHIDTLSVSLRAMGNQDNIIIATLKTKVPRKTREAAKNGAEPLENGNGKKNTQDQLKQTKVEEESVDQKRDPAEGKEIPAAEANKLEEKQFDLGKTKNLTLALDKINGSYNFSFHMIVGPRSEGLYNLKFHYCKSGMFAEKLSYSFSVNVTETNPGSYLSAAEIPLSRLYICMAGVFFIAALVWVYTLMKHRYSVFKIHWLMAALAFTKSISLVFHSINYHFINTQGRPIEGWAVMYYITHLLKGALLFITLALIGTGWAFVKYILSDKEKKIFMIVIPLQVLANVAYIIIESTEEGSSEYNLWKEILFLVDLICCGAILFPVVWSIRHLQEASSTDGKGENPDLNASLVVAFSDLMDVFSVSLSAAMNLEKLKLFRHYYVMIVCYIYFTRIIAILLKVTMPFQWQWCYEFLVEVSTLIFFVMTGYKFRPASNNPYLQLPQDEEDVEMDEVVTESGALEGISKVKKTLNGRERQKESTL